MIWFWLWILWRHFSNMKPEWVVAIATVVYAVCTLWLIFEMRKDRKLAYGPIIKLILNKSSSYYPQRLVLSLKNVGRGPALNLEIECKDTGGKRWTMENYILPIKARETIQVVLVEEDTNIGGSGSVFLDIRYKDIFSKTHTYHEMLQYTFLDLLRTRLP